MESSYLPPDRKPTFQDWIEYLLLRSLGFIVTLLPRPVAIGVAWPLGIFACDILRIRRKVTLENLEQAFPDKSLAERRKIARTAYINLAVVGMEMLRVSRLNKKKVIRLVTLDEESEALYQTLVKEGKGVIFLSGHYGSWELSAARIAAVGYPTTIIVKDQSNPLVNRQLTKARVKLGYNITGKGQAIRNVLKTLKGGGTVALLADQDAGIRSELFIDFFGKPASTYQGPAAFAVRSGSPILGCWIHREGLTYRQSFERLDTRELTDLPADADEETRIRRLMEVYVRWMEERIKLDPGQYLWLHRRWKSRPEGEAN